MNKRDVVLSLLNEKRTPPYTPGAFFLHFGPEYERGQAAIDKHLEYFHYTNMDFVKIQYEHPFPHLDFIQKPEDWAKVPVYPEDFFEAPLAVIKGLVKGAGSEALVVQTLYSPYMLAGQTAGAGLVDEHIRANPDAVKKGLEIITESLINFVKAGIRLGLDGFYTSTQGGEAFRFKNNDLFQQVIKPFDLAIWDVIAPACPFNILHICDYVGAYDTLTSYLDYPGQVVNCSLQLDTKQLTGEEVSEMFGRPFMGGIERKGVIATGNPEQIRQAVDKAFGGAPERFILAADCTVPSGTPWDNLRTAIDIAHRHGKG